MNRPTVLSFAMLAPLCVALGASAQTLPPPQNVLQLSANASTEVPQDMLTLTLSVQRDGTEAALVQTQLTQVLDGALGEARKAVRSGQLEVRTGGFALYPRYSTKGNIGGWQGRADLVIEGRDMPAISQLAGRLQGMVVASVVHSLSREAREKAEAEVSAQAIGRFKARAEHYARLFGFGGYSIREVTVGQADAPMPSPRVRAMAATMAVDEGVPVEAGKANVSVTVSGSIQMSPR